MEKVYNISEVKFEKNYMILIINNQTIKLELARFSEKLSRATDQQKNDYKISPSGYGIHWRQLDEDLSINGLLKVDNSASVTRL